MSRIKRRLDVPLQRMIQYKLLIDKMLKYGYKTQVIDEKLEKAADRIDELGITAREARWSYNTLRLNKIKVTNINKEN